MDYLKLKAIYDELLERIDRYYDGKLMQESRAKDNLEMYKDELLQELQIELWSKHNSKTYETYDPEVFIWLKAENVWIAFTRRLNRKSNQSNKFEFADLPENSFTGSFLNEFESKDTMGVIESILSTRQMELWRFRAQGLSYKEIKDLAEYPTEAAAKTNFNRIKKFIRLRFGRL